MNKKFLTLVVIGTLVSFATYWVLNLVAPYQKPELHEAGTVSVDEVFNGAAPVPATTEEPAAAAEEVTAAEPSEPVAAVTEATTPAEPPAETEPAAASEPVAAAEPVVEPTAQPAPEAAAPKAAAKPSEPIASAPAPVPTPAVAASNWWGKNDPATLSLVFAGSASYEKAIALLFNGNFEDAAKAAESLQVSTEKGAKVSGSWKLSPNNSQMLVFPVAASGTYTVAVSKNLKDQRGRSPAQNLRGPVTVK